MTSEVLGEHEGRGHDMGCEIDDLPMASVVYVGRGSFRMEAIALEPELARSEGIVQPITSMRGVVTAPLHTTPRPIVTDRLADDGVVSQVPPLRSLFSSKISVPLLAAPSGAINGSSSRVTITRASLVTLGALVLLCGIVVGTAARHLLASPAPLTVVVAPAAPAAPMVARAVTAPPVVAQPASAPEVETAPPSPPPMMAVPSPVRVRAHAKPAAFAKPPVTASASESASAPAAGAPKPWVDPWAE